LYIAKDLQQKWRQIGRLGKPALAAVLVGLILLLLAMAACPELHEYFHKDADCPDHHCAVTLLAHGKVSSATVDVAVVTQPVSIQPPSPVFISPYAPAIEHLPAGRAPPVLSFAS
jgi:hypothetical protein